MRFQTRSSSEDGPREQPSEDVHDAVIAHIWDVGLQPGYQGDPKHKVCILFELAEKDSKGRRFNVFMEMTASLYKKGGKRSNLRKIADDLRPDKDNGEAAVNNEGGTSALHGLACRVNIEYADNGKARVRTVLKPSPAGASLVVSGEYNDDNPLGLAKWMAEHQLTQAEAEAIRARNALKAAGGEDMGDLPPELR